MLLSFHCTVPQEALSATTLCLAFSTILQKAIQELHSADASSGPPHFKINFQSILFYFGWTAISESKPPFQNT